MSDILLAFLRFQLVTVLAFNILRPRNRVRVLLCCIVPVADTHSSIYIGHLRAQSKSTNSAQVTTPLSMCFQSKYYPGDKKLPRIKSGFFSWLPLIHVKEPELLEKIDPVAVAFLRSYG